MRCTVLRHLQPSNGTVVVVFVMLYFRFSVVHPAFLWVPNLTILRSNILDRTNPPLTLGAGMAFSLLCVRGTCIGCTLVTSSSRLRCCTCHKRLAHQAHSIFVVLCLGCWIDINFLLCCSCVIIFGCVVHVLNWG